MTGFHVALQYDIYDQDNPPGDAHGWIQWKGTDACIDLHCACGNFCHQDGMFMYFWRCPDCGRTYALGMNVKLIPLTDDQVREVEANYDAATIYVGDIDD